MYHHNISTLIADRYVAAWNHIGTEVWIDFGPAGARYSVPEIISAGGTYTGALTTSVGMQGGVTHYTDANGNAIALRAESNQVRIQSVFTSYSYTKLFGVSITGKPTVVGDYLVITDRVYSRMAFYALDGSYIGLMNVEGNPDVAYADGNTVYIPLGYQGLLVINTDTAFN